MKTETAVIKSKAIFSDNREHRLLLCKEWDKNRPKATIILINPNTADTLNIDNTTMLIINNLNQLGFGSVDIVNMYSRIALKLYFRFNSDSDLLDSENDEIILKSAEKSDRIIIAWGSVGNNSQRVRNRQKNILEMLADYSEKICIITDGETSKGYHPLTPKVRESWILKPYSIKKFLEEYENENNK